MWESLLSKKRYRGADRIEVDSSEGEYRNSFHKDYDRLIFSNSFRRLSRKTQVHPLSKNDHVHNRLTHSLEVACVGRSLGLQVGAMLKKTQKHINPYDIAYIVQTACLAHDIGNPPFGHAGEEVIKEWFKKNKDEPFLKKLKPEEISDFLYFDGNAQSFRTVTYIENNPSAGGMNLTFATLGALVKYPYSSAKAEKTGKFNYHQSEKELFEIIFSELGLKTGDSNYKRHPLSYLMEAADDICYGLLDIQDALELKIINTQDTDPILNKLCSQAELEQIKSKANLTETQKTSKAAAIAINNLTCHAMETFEANIHDILTGNQPKDIISIFSNEDLKNGIQEAKNLARQKIFNEKRKIELELGSYNIIETILNNLIPAAHEFFNNNGEDLSFRNKRALELMGTDKPQKGETLYNMYQRVIDHLVGMTDNYARHTACQLNGIGD
ncbi:dGTPase [Azotobacter beijerinckii]|uniref:dGTPase n=1 Tax=Azotobacter beijerinckii TaxID=170623 RepID=A0A1H6S973_9GAMM|nr:deoxyguanosinetriphosphate triphosphohydrolase [Azotobacter beijerinckii]SEI64471.1 dGTPase [Azotobacter beijerinckii]